jgi:hypothetical protein
MPNEIAMAVPNKIRSMQEPKGGPFALQLLPPSLHFLSHANRNFFCFQYSCFSGFPIKPVSTGVKRIVSLIGFHRGSARKMFRFLALLPRAAPLDRA